MQICKLRPLEANPFLNNRLAGWSAPHANVRFPVTFGLYRDGDNLVLMLTPSNLSPLLDALALPPTDQGAIIDPSAPGPIRAVPWSEVAATDEVDLVHLPASVDLNDPRVQARLQDLPQPLLGAPGHALPTDLGGQISIAVADGCHAAVITQGPQLLERCLHRFIEEFIVAVRLEDTLMPELDPSLVRSLLAPIPDGSWFELNLKLSKRVWTLEFELFDDEGPSDVFRWVSEGEGGRWRAGWSW